VRGRLIIPFLVEIRQMDTAATAALDPDGPGPLVSGFDPDFKEPVRVTNAYIIRQEKPPVLVECQPEIGLYGQLNQQNAGNDPRDQFTLIFHFQYLEEHDLVDAVTGEAKIRVGDRAIAIYKLDGTFIQRFGLDGEGFFCTEAQPQSFGLSGGERNLLICTFESRDKAAKG
jgi:hypothetical protein